MVIGIDIDNTITHTTETIMHYARIFGEQRGLILHLTRAILPEDTLLIKRWRKNSFPLPGLHLS